MAAAAAVTGCLTDVRALTDISASIPDSVPVAAAPTDSKDFCKDEVIPPPMVKHEAKEHVNSGSAAGMPKFTTLTDVLAAPMPRANIDTDAIIPKQFLKTIKRTGLGVSAFFEWRYEDDGVTEKPDFVLNKAAYRKSQILVCGENFGCGSSREHAPWSINDFGIKCLIATSFADIFYNNCFKNGMLPITLPKEQVDELMADAEAQKKLSIDLPKQEITRQGGAVIKFEVDSFRKHCLVNGLDDIGLTLLKGDEIDAFEVRRSAQFPWLDGPAYSSTTAEVRVSMHKGSSFYAQIARSFLEGQEATEELPARPPAARLFMSGTGAAIDRTVAVAQELESSGHASITKIQTDFLALSGGAPAPFIRIVLATRSKPKALTLAGGTKDSAGKTDW